MQTKRIKILKTKYDQKRDLVQWYVEEATTRRHLVLAWPGSDLGPAVGVNMHLPPHLIVKFCQDIEGKTINLQAIADVKEIDPKKLQGMSEEDLLREHGVFDKYPYAEVLETLEDEGRFKDARKQQQTSNHEGNYTKLRDFLKDED